jgi:CHAT domain-containing protein/tetratricopeptide (TPR) repeat protein
MRGIVACLLLVLAPLTGCEKPPASAYVRGTSVARPSEQTSLGSNTAGEACVQQPAGARGAVVFCGSWQQPSARVEFGGPATVPDMAATASSGTWRTGIDARMQCEAPTATTILGGQPALLLSCASRQGGWPQIAMVTVVNGTLWRGDAVLPAATAMERSIGVLSGLVRPDTAPPGSQADGLLARRLAAQPFTASDVGAFYQLMTAGIRANLANDPTDAELAFRAAVALQRKVLGRNDPNTATTLVTLAVQVSNQGRYSEADELFTEATPLVQRSADSTARARLLHYRGLHAKNEGKSDEALALLTQAEAAYAVWIPADALYAQLGPRGSTGSLIASGQQRQALVRPNPSLLADPRAELAMVGLIEARRNRALVLRQIGRSDEAEAAVASAIDLATANGVDQPMLSARLYRTLGVAASSLGANTRSAADFARSSGRFEVALPGSKTLAETELLHAASLQRAGRSGAAVSACRAAVQSLIALKTGIDQELIAPCLIAYASEADHNQTLLAEMFLAAQVAQGGITAEQIAEASARLRANARDPKVATAIRAWQDASDKLSALYGQRDAIALARQQGRPPPNGVTQTDIDQQIAAGQSSVAEADSALQAAAPNYGQLVQQVVPAADVIAVLRPHEAFMAITISARSGWVFLLRPGAITVSTVPGGTENVAKLVHDIRASIELTATGVPRFDTEHAQALYAATVGGVANALDGVTSLVIAPTGPLLSLPFAVLLSGPANPDALASAPWLIRKFALADVPAPANFVSLRKIAGTSRAGRPWFGFGDFRPITLAQAARSFPGASCADSARLLAGLPALPYTQKELEAARQLMGASASDELLGPAFTADAVTRVSLRDYRTLQFSTHALLPAELRCQDQPAIVTSAPSGAGDASGAMLTTDRILGLNLDADLVILSACNSGGPGGTTAGESLSGLARAFFYAGARSMLVTHWSVNDQAAAYLVTDTLRRMRAGDGTGVAEAMRGAELSLLDAAVKSPGSLASHPFFWAPFAVIGGEGEVRAAVGGPS